MLIIDIFLRFPDRILIHPESAFCDKVNILAIYYK